MYSRPIRCTDIQIHTCGLVVIVKYMPGTLYSGLTAIFASFFYFLLSFWRRKNGIKRHDEIKEHIIPFSYPWMRYIFVYFIDVVLVCVFFIVVYCTDDNVGKRRQFYFMPFLCSAYIFVSFIGCRLFSVFEWFPA